MTGHTPHTAHTPHTVQEGRGRTATLPRHGAHRRAEAPPDAALLAGAREGDATAFAELYRRHAREVRRHARELGLDADTAEDLTGEAFAQTLGALRDGGGPRASLRDHLLATVVRLATERSGDGAGDGGSRDIGAGDADDGAAGQGGEARGERPVSAAPREVTQLSAEAQAMVQADRELLVAAFSQLPSRWREVLWRTAVERQSLGRVSSALGLTTNATAVLAFRAREGLRRAYLQAHVSDDLAGREACRRHAGRLGAFVRGSSASRGLRRHLDVCRRCRAAYLELVDVNATLRAVFPVAATGWLAAAAAASWPEAAGGGLAGGGLAGGTSSGLGVAGLAGPATAAPAAGVGGGGGALAKLTLAASVALAAGTLGQQPGHELGPGSQQRDVTASARDAAPDAEAEPAAAAPDAGDGATPPAADPGPRRSGREDGAAASSCPYPPDDHVVTVSLPTGLGGLHDDAADPDGLDDLDGLDGHGDFGCRTGLSVALPIEVVDPGDPVDPVDTDRSAASAVPAVPAPEETTDAVQDLDAVGAIDALRDIDADGTVAEVGAATREVTDLLLHPRQDADTPDTGLLTDPPLL
ncbi:RNA polymerase sigma factor [Streptomyces sp. 4N509B]|uniref:RNA polymerase sigma factor n=1 Tax=Streptomyces sp. 4N509B TaxID=3457413 RepID=UPI003FD55B42